MTNAIVEAAHTTSDAMPTAGDPASCTSPNDSVNSVSADSTTDGTSRCASWFSRFGEGIAAILHAQHHERFRAIVAHRTLAGGRYPHHGPFGHGEALSVHLELAPAAEEEVQFLMLLVGVQEARLRAGLEDLEGEFAARGMERRAAKYLAGNFHVRTQFQYIIAQLTQLAYADGAEVASVS